MTRKQLKVDFYDGEKKLFDLFVSSFGSYPALRIMSDEIITEMVIDPFIDKINGMVKN